MKALSNSRIVLSLLGLFIATTTTLAWVALDKPGLGTAVFDDHRAQYLICGLALFSAISWFVTYCRPKGFKYLVCSRLLLSALSCIFGACLTLVIVEYGAPSDLRAILISNWQFWTYAGAAMLACPVWAAIYYRSLMRARRGGLSANSSS